MLIFIALNGGNKRLPAISRCLQINFRFPRSPQNGRWALGRILRTFARWISQIYTFFLIALSERNDQQAARGVEKRTLFANRICATSEDQNLFDREIIRNAHEFSLTRSCVFIYDGKNIERNVTNIINHKSKHSLHFIDYLSFLNNSWA